MANELDGAFSKAEVHMAEKYMRFCSLSLAIKEMEIQTMLRFRLNPVRMATIKST
jgi:hypothetical protein